MVVGVDEILLGGTRKQWRDGIENRRVEVVGQFKREDEGGYVIRLLGIC